jgi:hypothetical protein
LKNPDFQKEQSQKRTKKRFKGYVTPQTDPAGSFAHMDSTTYNDFFIFFQNVAYKNDFFLVSTCANEAEPPTCELNCRPFQL